MLSVDEQMHVIKSGVADIVPEAELIKKLQKGVPLRIKLGVDPTAPDLHLGHAVPLRKMRQFQDLGHTVVLIVGDRTALIGDPSGRNSTRPPLTVAQIEENAKTYIAQAYKILDPEKTELRYNSEWMSKMGLEEILTLCSKFTVARILERDDFTKRYSSNTPIALHEFLYPTMQANDSVAVEADVEMGGTDQLFNLLAGRELMAKNGMEPQICLTMPLLEGTDGVRKMSKSYGNYIGLTDTPEDMFGKVMSIPDEMIVRYSRLASTYSVDKADQIEAAAQDGSWNPNFEKRELAKNIITAYHSAEEAVAAEEYFNQVHREHAVPEDIETAVVDLSGEVYVPAIINAVGFAKSAGEGRRLIDGGGVKVDGEALSKGTYNVEGSTLDGVVLQVGKRRFIKLQAE